MSKVKVKHGEKAMLETGVSTTAYALLSNYSYLSISLIMFCVLGEVKVIGVMPFE